MSPRSAPLTGDDKVEALAFTAFQRPHWQKLCSTNPLERINREIKRRSRVVGIFPQRTGRDPPRGAVLADMTNGKHPTVATSAEVPCRN
jgi:putative transposase